jgi:hypothetical protein
MDRDCTAVYPLLSARLDGVVLDEVERTALDTHLAACPACRALDLDLVAEERALAALWPPVAAPEGFAARVVVGLPPRPITRLSHRRVFLVAAVLAALLCAALLGRGEVGARIDLALQRVGLRESSPPTQTLAPPLHDVSLEEARGLVPWPIRQPEPPAAGYRLARISAGAVYPFAAGPVIFLFYQRDNATVPQLVITEFRAANKGEISASIAEGAGQRVPVGERSGLFIDGMWVERGGRQVWERGTLVRLIVEDGDLVIQFDADPNAGWDATTLAALAVRLR